MSGRGQDRDEAPAGSGPHAAIHYGNGDIHQAGRDIHIHHEDGVRGTLRFKGGRTDQVCPFPGLAAFTREQSEWFFGRDRLLADLVARLDRRLSAGGIQVVVGPSGAGKSSLLQAGLASRLRAGALPASGTWAQMVLTPTADPVGALVSAIRSLAPDTETPSGASPQEAKPTGMTRKMSADPTRCVRLLQRTLDNLGDADADADAVSGRGERPRAVIVVDQFEELFTHCSSERRRTAFIDLLSRIADGTAEGGPAALVVIGLRADFLPECLRYALLQSAVEDRILTVGPMSETELRQVIKFPARDADLQVEPGLVDVLLRDLGLSSKDAEAASYETGRLPLLAHALRATWQQRSGATLTVHGYRLTGGIHGAVAKSADHVYESLSAAERKISRLLFLRLVRIGDGSDDVRRRLPREEAVGNGIDPDAASVVLEAFSAARLITQDRETVEITHEVLLHAWPQLRKWIDSNREGRLIHQQLEEAARAWKRSRRNASKLFRGIDLETAEQWSREVANQDDLSALGHEFITDSLRARARAQRRTSAAIAVLTVLVVIASGAASFAFVKKREAEEAREAAVQQRKSAVQGQLIAQSERLKDSDISTGAQLNVSAHLVEPTAQTGSRLIMDANNPLSKIVSRGAADIAVFNPADSSMLAVGGAALQLVNRRDPQHPQVLWRRPGEGSESVRSIGFSKNGKTLALVNSGDSPIQICMLGDGRDSSPPVHILNVTNAEARGPSTAALSPNGRILAVGFDSGGIRLVNIENPGKPVVLGTFIRTGHGLIAGIDTDGASILRVFKKGGGPRELAFSPDGRILAARVNDDVLLWKVDDPARPVATDNSPIALPQTKSATPGVRALRNHGTLTFSPDNKTLAVGDYDGIVNMVAVAGHRSPTALGRAVVRPRATASAVAFSAGGHTLAVGRSDGMVQIWNVADPKAPRLLHESLAGHTAPVSSVSFSRDGSTLATVSTDKVARSWRVPTTSLLGHTGAVTSLAFTSDGRTLATGSEDRTARLWHVADTRRPRQLGEALTGHSASITSVALSHDGSMLATGSAVGWDVRLWHVKDPLHAKASGKPMSAAMTPVDAVAMSPEQRILATSSTTGKITLWRVAADGRPVKAGRAHIGLGAGAITITSLAYSPDGRTLAGGSSDGLIRLWDVADPDRAVLRGGPLSAHTDAVTSVAFSPDGRTLASGSDDWTVRLWDVADPDKAVVRGGPLSAHTDAVTSVAFSPDGRTLASGSDDWTVRLWDVADPDKAVVRGGPLSAHTDAVTSVAFSPDGRTLASGSDDWTVRLWRLDLAGAVRDICKSTDIAQYRRQWTRVMGDDIPYAPSCEALGPAR